MKKTFNPFKKPANPYLFLDGVTPTEHEVVTPLDLTLYSLEHPTATQNEVILAVVTSAFGLQS